MGGSAEKPILLDEEEDKEKSPSPRTIPVSESNTTPCIAEKLSILEQDLKMFLIMFAEFCFNRYYCVCVLI